MGNMAGVLLHESLHAHMKAVLGEDYQPLLKELAKLAGLAEPGQRASTTLVESQLGQRLKLTDQERALFDQAMAVLPKAVQDQFKADFLKAQNRKDGNPNELQDLINDMFYAAARAKQLKAVMDNAVVKSENMFKPAEKAILKAAQAWLKVNKRALKVVLLTNVSYAVLRNPSDREILNHGFAVSNLMDDLEYDLRQQGLFDADGVNPGFVLHMLERSFPTLSLSGWDVPAVNEIDILLASPDEFIARVQDVAAKREAIRAQASSAWIFENVSNSLVENGVYPVDPNFAALTFAGALVQVDGAPKGNIDWRPRVVNVTVLEAAVDEFPSVRNGSFVNYYNSVINKGSQQFIAHTTDDGATWRHHKRAQKADNKNAYNLAVMSVQVNSHTGWCIKTPTYSTMYLDRGDIWLFNDGTGKPRLAIRFEGDAIAEIQEPQNDKSVSDVGQRRLIELAKTGLIDTKALLEYAKNWQLFDVVAALGTDADKAAVEKKADYARDAAQNGLLAAWEAEADVQAAEFAAGDFLGPEEENNQRADNPEPDNPDVQFSVATDGDLGASSDADWIARGRARVQFAGVSPEMQAEEFAAYAVENYELAPAGFQKWVDSMIAKFKLNLSKLLRSMKVAPRWRVQLLNDPAVLREIALVGLRTAAGRAESSTNFGAGSIWGDTAVAARVAAERVFGQVWGSVKAERVAEAVRKIQTAAPRGYQAPDQRILNVDVHNLNLFFNAVLTPAQRQSLYDLAHGTYAEFFRQFPEQYAMMLSNKYGREYTLYNLYSAYKGGALGEAAEERGFRYAMKMIAGKARQFFDIYTSDDLAQQILRDLSDGTLENAAATNAPYQPEMRLRAKQSSTGNIMQGVIDATEKAGEIFQKIFYNDYDVARASGIAAYDEIINRLQYRSGERLGINPDGTVNRGMLPAVQHKIGYFLSKMDKAVSKLSKESQEKVALERYFNLPDPRPGKLNEAETEAFYAIRDMYREGGKYGVDNKVLEAGAVENNPDFAPVIFDIGGNVEKHKATLREILMQHETVDGDRRFKYAKMLDALYVEKNKPQTRGAVQEHFTAATQTQQDAFINQVIEYALFDPSDVVLDNQLGNEFKHAGRRLFDDIYKNYQNGDKADLEKLVTTLEPSLAEQGVRYFEPLVVRAEYNRAFPDGLDKKLIEQMRKQGATEKQLAAASRVLNAAQYKFDFPVMGRNGEKGSPTIGMISETLAMKMHNRKTLRTMQNLSAWQNLRLLPLGLLSSLVDPQGIAMRSGGDVGIAWRGLQTGLRGLMNADMQEALHQLAEAAGYSAEISAAQALHDGFGAGSRTPWARKINSLIFKWNGLEAWTRQSRLMGMVAAHESLVKWQKWARGEDPAKKAQAERYFSELGLQVDDVRIGEIADGPLAGRPTALLLTDAQKLSATPEQLAANERVKGALVQFVDEAILRPNILQTPGWFKDPFVQIFVQYKAFSYALFEQISRRMAIELGNGNYAVLNAALSYLPFILLAELLREMIQWGPEGNPQRNQWGVPEYAGLAIAKTGFAGPRMEYIGSVKTDVDRGNVPGTSALGPTVGAAGMIKDSATGQRNWGTTLESLAPGSSLWKRWNDDNGGGSAGLARKPAAE